MKTQQVILTTSVIAAAELTRRRFVGFNGNVCAAGVKALGVVEADTENGGVAPANVLGVILVEAGAAIAAGAEVQSDASGKAIELEVDGGVTPETAPLCVAAGATALVAGTAVFKGGPAKYAENIRALKGG